MLKKKGFTLIELMVVILIVSILAAVAIPIMRGRIDAAKWSEGRSMAGTIATGLRAYAAEHGDDPLATDPDGGFGAWGTLLGFAAGDLTGTYFVDGDFDISGYAYDGTSTTPLTFTIQVTGSETDAPSTPAGYTLNARGEWAELSAP